MTRSLRFTEETDLSLRPLRAPQQAPGHRRARRRSWRHAVTLRDEQGWGPIRLDAVDISASGLFVESDLLFEPGQGFLLEFESPVTGALVRVWSRVSRVGTPGACNGMAFEFLDLPEERQGEIELYAHH
jgi:hypothetical protein